MKRVLVVTVMLIVIIAFSSAAIAGSGVFLNDSGHTARAIRITFSEPVEITGFGDGFNYQSPKGKATTFVFTGMPLNESWTFWVSWSPDSATVVKKEWLKTGGGVQLDIAINGEPETLDPSLDSGGSAAAWVVEQLFLGLVDYDEDGDIVPELAKSWESSSDATVWTFTLRDDVTWSDGVPVTAKDVKCGLLRALDPEHAYPYPYVFDAIRGARAHYTGEVTNSNELGVKVLDEHRIQFTLDRPASYFPALAVILPFFAVPKHVIDTMGDAWAEPESIVTDGPYRLVNWVHGDYITLEKNENYYAVQDVQIERVVMWVIDKEAAWVKYRAGLLDTVDISSGTLEAVTDNSSLAEEIKEVPGCGNYLGPGTYFYGFNVKLPPFDNPLVRKAFVSAVDRDGVMKAASLAGLITFPELALTLVPPGISDHVNGEEEGIGIPYDPEQAREWLAEAGYPGGAGLPRITLWFNDSVPYHQAAAEYVRKNWIDNLGVTVELHSMALRDYVDKLNAGQCQIWRLGWCADYPDAYNWAYDLINVWSHWRDQTFDSLVEEAARELDPQRRKDLYQQADRILVETDAVIMPLFYYGSSIATKPYLQRTFPSFGAPDIARWRLLPESGNH